MIGFLIECVCEWLVFEFGLLWFSVVVVVIWVEFGGMFGDIEVLVNFCVL